MEHEEEKKIMIDALKKVYKDQYDAIQPIPFVKDKIYCVDKIFVEGGADVTSFKGNPPGDLEQLEWTTLDSYKGIFKSDNTQLHRYIIYGDPGYGKSTLTLQLAYDWSNGISESPLCEIEMFILLRLRQLKNLGSIYKAVKHILLPTEPRLKVKDIEQIIKRSPSVVFALDGYDEFPHRSEQENDINKIITSELLQSIDITLTTRILPPRLIPRNHFQLSDTPTTKLVKLRGFDERAREKYIRKAVVRDDATAVERIKRQLKGNHAINALCQVPLLFVIFAHMFLEDQVIPKISTVTGAVRHMISCFHDHEREKMKDTNVKAVPDFKNEHSKLDKIAFEGLTNRNQQLSWKRDDLRKRLGEAFYDMYIRIGLLVEETVFYESLPTIEVHFYHKIFCEWFAAHYFVQFVKRSDVQFHRIPFNERYRHDIQTFSRFLYDLKANDLKYFFLFSCGLDNQVANKIINYLHGQSHIDQDILLSCISERSDDIDEIKKIVKNICSRYHKISEHSDMMKTRNVLRVLEIGSNNKLPIASLSVSLGSYCQEENVGISFPSGLRLPFFKTLKKLQVDFGDRIHIQKKEIVALLQTLMKFEQLDQLEFYRCILPDISAVAGIIQSRNIQIFWIIESIFTLIYQLTPLCDEWKLQLKSLETMRDRCQTNGITVNRSELTDELRIWSLKRLFREIKNNHIPMSYLIFDDQGNRGKVKADINLIRPSMIYSVQKIVFITEENTNISKRCFLKMMNYAKNIHSLTEVWFEKCDLPLIDWLRPGDLSRLRAINISVYWIPGKLRGSLYRLKLDSGSWEDFDTLLEVDDAYHDNKLFLTPMAFL